MQHQPTEDLAPSSAPSRITLKTIWRGALAAFNMGKGLFLTLFNLLFYPARYITDFITYDRSKLMNPVRFLFSGIAILLFLSAKLYPDDGFSSGFKDGFNNSESGLNERNKAVADHFLVFMDDFMHVLILFMVVPASRLTGLLINKRHWNGGEHLTANSFLLG